MWRVLLVLLCISSAEAQQLSGLPPATTPFDASEMLYMVQDGVSRRVTPTQLVLGTGGPFAPLATDLAGNTAVGTTTFPLGNGQTLNVYNTAVGGGALAAASTFNSQQNVAVGSRALNAAVSTANETAVGNKALWHDATGAFNTSIGSDTMRYFTGAGGTATGNTALGHGSMAGDDTAPVNMTSSANTGLGAWTLQELTTGSANTCGGVSACAEVQSGSANVALGWYANAGCNGCANNIGQANASSYNVAIGTSALESNSANGQVAVGWSALKLSTTGTLSTAVGYNSQSASVADVRNVSLGYDTLITLNGGSDNIAVGAYVLDAATTAARNTVVGSLSGTAITTGSDNTIIGEGVAPTTLTTGSGNILIGAANVVDTLASNTSNEINIGGLLFWSKVSVLAPTLSSCGTSPSIDARANMRSGTVTVGSTATTCTIAFYGTGYSTWNHCRVTFRNAAIAGSYSYTKTVITVTAAVLGGAVVDYDCDGV